MLRDKRRGAAHGTWAHTLAALALVFSACTPSTPSTEAPLDPTVQRPAELAAAPGWTATGSMGLPRSSHTATLLPNGKVLVAAGRVNGSSHASAQVYDPLTGAWTFTGSLAEAHSSHTATLLPNGKVLVTGGISSSSSLSTQVEAYDPATGTWSTTSPLAQARYGHAATLLPDGKVLVTGGSGASGTLSSSEVHDPATGTWAPTGAMTQARFRHTATLLPNGKVLVVGGYITSGSLASAELYDPATGTWAATGPLTQARAGQTATLLPNGKVLVVGGYNPSTSAPTLAEVYDPATGAWTATQPLTPTRSGHTATLLPDGKVLIAGGTTGTYPVTSVEAYDPTTGAWTPLRSLLSAHTYPTATLLPDGRVLVAGGSGSDSYDTDVAEVYGTPGDWAATRPLAQARLDSTATLLPQGKVLVAGGDFHGTPVAQAERYDPTTGTWTGTAPLGQARSRHTATLLPQGKVLVVGGHADTHSLAHVELYDPTTGTWAPTAPLAQARERHTATLLPDGKVLVTGGLDDTSSLASAEVYDPGTGSWSSTGPMTQARSSHTATLLPDGKVLVAGGINDTGFLASAEVYDPATGSWAPTSALPQASAHHTATLLPDGRVLVVGGDLHGVPLSRAVLYDPTSGSWSSTGALAQAREHHSATLLQDGRLLVTGGGGSALTAVASAEVYTPATGTWARAHSPAQARSRHTATLLPDGKVLVASGTDNNAPLSSAELYDPVIGTWNRTGSMTQARSSPTVTLLPDGKVLVAGGNDNDHTTRFRSAELYDPATRIWTATSPMTQARSGHTATLLPDGRVLVAGGDDGFPPPSTAEVYNPVTGTWTPTGPMFVDRAHHTATLLFNGRVLVIGGEGGGIFSAELYDPPTNTWIPGGPLPQFRVNHTATLLPDGKVLVVGGQGASPSADVYNPVTGLWAPTGSLANGRESHTATLLPDGKVLVTGGFVGYGSGTSAEVYDPATGTWASTGALPQARAAHTATLLADGKVLVAGSHDTTSASTEVYDPATGTWAPMGPLSQPRRFHKATLLSDGKVLAAGGGLDTIATAEVYQQGAHPAWRPTLSGISPSASLEVGSVFTVSGSRFRGLSEASSGTTSSSSSAVPLLTLRDLSRDRLLALSFQDFSSTHVTARLPAVPPGLYLLSVTVNGASSTAALAISAGPDTTPPTVTLTSPTEGARLEGAVSLSATASDDTSVTRVEFYDGDTLMGAVRAPPFRLSWNTRSTANGPHLLTVKAFDAAGQSTTSTGVNVQVDNDWTPPAVAFSSPGAGATVANTFTVVVAATDNVAVTRVDFYEGSARLCTDISAPYTCDWNTRLGPNGDRTLTAKAYDLVRNVGIATVTVTSSNDFTPPTVVLTAPDEGATLSGIVTLTAWASDPYGISFVDFYVGTTYVGTAFSPPYSLDYDTRDLPNGSHTLTAQAFSPENYMGISAPVNVTIHNDLTPPTVALTAPAAGATLVGTVTLSAAASDDTAVTRVEFYDGATLLQTVTAAPYSISWDSRTVANGSHVLTARAYDAAGNSTESTAVGVTVDNDSVPPTVALTAPAEGATVQGTVTLTATATDNVAVTRVEFYDGATRLSTDTASPYSFTWNTLTASNGGHTLSARAYDAKGNVGTAEVTVTVNNDFTPPTVALTAPAEGATVTGTVALSATASDNKAVTRVAFFVGSTQVGTDSTAPYSFSYNTRLLPNGPKLLTAKAYDAANNVATSTAINVTFDNDFIPPTVTLTAPAEGATLSGTVTLTASASDASGISSVAFFVGSTQVGTDSTAPYSFSYNTRLQSNGSKLLTARALDASSNTATSAAVNVTFDNDFTAPTVALTAPADGATLSGTVTFTATASDASGISKVAFFVGSTQVGTATSAPYAFSYNTRLLTNGSKLLTAKAYDAFNNLATSAAVSVTFDNDFTAPTTSLTSPTAGSTVSGVVQLEAIASDDRGTVTKVDFYRGTVLMGTVTSAPFTWSWNTTTATVGNNTLKTRAWDAAGNSAYSPNLTVTVTR